MPNPWDYKPNQSSGLLPNQRWYLILTDENFKPIYVYSRMVGKLYSRIKSTRKALFLLNDQPHEKIYFDEYHRARYAMIEIAKTDEANVPVGRYNIQICATGSNEPVANLPYYVNKEIIYVDSETQSS